MTKNMSLLLVDDQPLITTDYKSLPKDFPELKSVLVAHNEEEYWLAIKKHRKTIDVVVMDLMLDTAIPIAIRTETKVRFSGFSLMEETLEKYPSMKFVVYSQYMHDTNILQAYRMGARCFIAKHKHSMDSLITILKRVLEEGVVVPEEFSRAVINKIMGYQDKNLSKLTDEDLTIVDMLINGYETEDIREATNSVSSPAINNKISKILKTVDLSSRSALLLYALKVGMQPKENS